MKENYKIWDETREWPSILYLHGLHDDCEGFRLVLEDKVLNGCTYLLVFDTCLTYQKTDKGYCHNSLRDLIRDNRTEFKAVYVVENSEWITSFLKDNPGGHLPGNLIHFAIVTQDDWIDIIALKEPVVAKKLT